MINTIDAQSAYTLFEKSNRIALLPHRKPDGDAIASCFALAACALQHNKQVEIIPPTHQSDPFPPLLCIPTLMDLISVGTHTKTPDLIISCDTANYDRLYYPEEFRDIPLINIDHHVSNSITGTVNLVDTESSSTCEIIARLLQLWKAPITPDIAQILLYGLLSDTQCFKTSNTTPQTLRTASDLIEAGANLTLLTEALITHTNPSTLLFWGDLLSNTQFSPDKTIAWTVATPELFAKYKLGYNALVGFINHMAQITQIDISVLIYQEENKKCKVSLRSKKSDVNAFANTWNGGGHVRAAGLTSAEPEDLESFLPRFTESLISFFSKLS